MDPFNMVIVVAAVVVMFLVKILEMVGPSRDH